MKISKKRLEPNSLRRMFPPPDAKFAAEKIGSRPSEGKIWVQFFAYFFKKYLKNVLTNDLKKNLMVLFPLRGSSLKFTLCD